MWPDHNREDRIWQAGSPHSSPPTPEWIQELWRRHGKFGTKASERYQQEGQALLWFVTEWMPKRSPYRFPLPQQLVAWLNATELDFTREVTHRPGLHGPLPCDASKPVSRLMCMAGEQYRGGSFVSGQEYYDFLAWYAFSFLPEKGLTGILLPAAVVDLLNAPATNDGIPLTVAMLFYLKQAYADEVDALRETGDERIFALSFCAVEGMLSMGHVRLIPSAVSRFWRQRPQKLVTAFEHVAAGANNGGVDGAPGRIEQEEEIREWFQREVTGRVPRASLMSGLPAIGSAIETIESVTDNAIVVYRDHETVCGLSKAGAAARNALFETGIPIFDLHFSLTRDRLSSEMRNNQLHRTNARRQLHLVNVNPELIPECCLCNASRIWPEDYIVGQFYWELSRISKMHESGIALVDEVWAASRYLTDIFASETGKPVFTMGQAIVIQEPVAPLSRKEFGFSDDTYLFLCNFDAQSVVERKNPLGAVIAFQNAFPKGREPAGIIIKTRNLDQFCTERDPAHWASATERIQKDPRIRVIEHTMSADELAALYRMCDCFVSLHRSEGFGFGPAEAMAHGRPAIVTNYSGVCDFCTPATAKLVPFELVRVRNNEYPYLDRDRVYEWADPDLTVAAECMRELAEDREQSRRLGRAAQEMISREYSLSALKQRYLERLEALGFVEGLRLAEIRAVGCR